MEKKIGGRGAMRTWFGGAFFVVAVALLHACGSGPAPEAVPLPLDNQTLEFKHRNPVLPSEPFSYAADLPAHFLDDGAGSSVISLDPTGRVLNDRVVAVGRVLFYDVNLSSRRTVRCASCHAQADSFSDSQPLSLGVNAVTDRHSMSLANIVFTPQNTFFWDQRASSLEEQIAEAITGPKEMALPLPETIVRVREQPYYAELFNAAYGNAEITEDRILSALGDFVRAMVSANATYDVGRADAGSPLEPFGNFSEQENEGKALFFTGVTDGGGSCSNCHSGEAQVTVGPRNNGLSVDDVDQFGRLDVGVLRATGLEIDRGSFRSPSLRNVEVTEPYMHDGRFFSLKSVVQHYNRGIADHPFLDPELRDASGAPVRLGWSDDQVDAVVAFLRTLTDDEFLADPRFSDPFR